MKGMFKHLTASMLGFVLILTSVVPAIRAEESAPDVSAWAIETLNEGEKYGIYPIEWYYDGFRSDITAKKADELIRLTEKKIAALQLPENKKYRPIANKKGTTRGDIVNRLYDIVARYDLSVGNNAVAYMKERNILKGSTKGLQLGKKSTTENAVVLAIRFIQDTYHLAEQGSKGVAWTVEDEDTLVYLLGSIHLGTPELYPFNKKLLTAFEESDALLVEANILDPEGLDYYAQKALYTDGTTLKDHVSAETFAKIEKVAKLYNMPMEQLVKQKPWLLSSAFSMLGVDETFGLSSEEMAMHGIDMYFLLSALLKDKTIIELEGTKAQVDMFEALTPKAQEQSLVEVIDSILEPPAESVGPSMQDWFDSWKKGEVSAFAESLKQMEGEPSEYNRMLFGKRDLDMAQKIQSILKEEEGTYFVVVGAGHFLVDQNIRYHLEKAGYSVEPFYQ
ncbi:TraB/GumN family protein [Lysinibacillus yapensis]|uniref:TraB/GumN family protein n=1 Tax=Ureibacillus yapensis TaxID=2304605 RepID=A0A396SF56_9BACL|nr:TraB/GumN family protein [Lysinibacillus yapensis]RHW39964.1 TraB/GumN family protein [Lysinibacillus yapensis]